MGSRYDKEEIRFKRDLQKVRKKVEAAERKQFLKNEKNKIKPKKKMQASKVYLIMLFASCFSVQAYAMAAMWHFCDLSSLSTLIGATLTEGIGLLGYFAKAFLETKEEELVKLEREKMHIEDAAG